MVCEQCVWRKVGGIAQDALGSVRCVVLWFGCWVVLGLFAACHGLPPLSPPSASRSDLALNRAPKLAKRIVILM